MPLEIAVRRVGDIALIMCTGRIVAGTESEILERQMNKLLEFERDFVLHLGAVTFVDSSGLGLLVRLAGMTRARHGDLKLCAVARDVDHTLDITHLKQVLETHPTEVEALRAFYQPARRAPGAVPVGRQVLCIDRSANVLALLREILRQAGYSPIATDNFHDARLLCVAARPALVVLGPNISPERMAGLAEVIGAAPHVALQPGFETLDAGEASALLLGIVQGRLSASAP